MSYDVKTRSTEQLQKDLEFVKEMLSNPRMSQASADSAWAHLWSIQDELKARKES